jgi:hypothetical protein
MVQEYGNDLLARAAMNRSATKQRRMNPACDVINKGKKRFGTTITTISGTRWQ